jgi:LuxR family maltose regulon positive regulatory protein
VLAAFERVRPGSTQSANALLSPVAAAKGLDRLQAQRFIGAFEGTNRHVLNYLTKEVLQRQTPAIQAFLLQTSILPYLAAPLCDAVTGRPGSQPLLQQLANDNLFTTPLDNEGRW